MLTFGEVRLSLEEIRDSCQGTSRSTIAHEMLQAYVDESIGWSGKTLLESGDYPPVRLVNEVDRVWDGRGGSEGAREAIMRYLYRH